MHGCSYEWMHLDGQFKVDQKYHDQKLKLIVRYTYYLFTHEIPVQQPPDGGPSFMIVW